MAHRPNTNAPSDHHVDFLQQFVAKERERAAKPAPLSAQEHAANRKRLGTVRFVKPKYADETQSNVSGILKKWTRPVCRPNAVGADLTNCPGADTVAR
ncbi:hypothetical protein C2W62_48365 [Candidatus Entotheonella serta]|nr:hypothetical protein C2W62_48365 [Candidatus Entotheonella serta]